jgi:hypothetical protein
MEDRSIVLVIANKKDGATFSEGTTVLFPDCTMSIEHKFENEVTEHPVDGKSSISDHVINKNNTISVSGIYNAHNIVRYVGDAIAVENRVADAYRYLLKLRDERLPFSIVSRYDVYNDCVIKSLTIPIAPDQGNTLIFNMDVVQIRKAKRVSTVRLVQLEDVSVPVEDSAAFEQSSGSKQTNRSNTTATVTQADRVINGSRP